MSERNYDLEVTCRMCGVIHILKVKAEDYITYDSPNRPHVQDIFPYLTPAERELLISGTCPDCWNRMFGGEDDE